MTDNILISPAQPQQMANGLPTVIIDTRCCPVNSLSLRDDSRDGGGRTKFEPESRGLG